MAQFYFYTTHTYILPLDKHSVELFFDFIIVKHKMWNLCTRGCIWVDAYVILNVAMPDLNISAVALHNNISFCRQEWIHRDENDNQQIPSLHGPKGVIILTILWDTP